MSIRLLLVALLMFVMVVACSAGPSVTGAPSPSSPAGPSASPTVPIPADPSASPAPTSPAPTQSPKPPVATPVPTATPSAAPLSVEETYLIAGARGDLFDCVPVRDGLPPASVGGIECKAENPAVAKVGFYLFDGDADMVAAYFARMDAEGVERESGSCADGEGEHAYIPGDDDPDYRHGCFVNEAGYANYRATLPLHHVYIGVLGRTAVTRALEQFAWRGSTDTPGNPTLWAEPEGGY